jgi:hypothetical protein
MLFPLLDGLQDEAGRLAPSQPAPEQKGNHRVVTESSKRRGPDPVHQTSTLFRGQPVAEAHAQPPDPLHATNAGGELRTEEPGVRRFVRRCVARRRVAD